jgi:hypothetical protein
MIPSMLALAHALVVKSDGLLWDSDRLPASPILVIGETPG